jgi:maltose alpha-D-glucosyltransferase/alpha-amylase
MSFTNLWYKQAIVYAVDVKTFQDGNGDGIGDFPGLTSRLSHIAGLGATCLWLQPFYPSPLRDDGYDVADYYAIDPRLGTFGDFAEFLQAAENHGLKVIADLVVNHSSSDHPWFQKARRSPDSPWRDWYIWSQEKPADTTSGMIFPGVQQAVWTFDEEANAWYHHHFYHHEPDLNIANPAVREEITRIIGFWLRVGLSGFRLDAAPFLLERQRELPEYRNDVYAFIREFRQTLSWQKGHAVFLAEANVPPEEAIDYFEAGVQIHMMFNFPVNQNLFLALARQSSAPLEQALRELPQLPAMGQWANFLRNHDELDLGRLSDDDRQSVYRNFAPDAEMRLYDRGIRRRLASMLGGDVRRIQLAHSLLLTLPGTPVLRYGDEIGMGDDLRLPERLGVRTPMQWSNESNAGFSTADAKKLIRPAISGGEFGYETLNVAAQQRHSESLLNWIERAIRVRKECPEFGLGRMELLKSDSDAVLAYRYDYERGAVLAIHNLSEKPTQEALRLELQDGEQWIELLGSREGTAVEGGSSIDLNPYGFRWLRLCGGRYRAA